MAKVDFPDGSFFNPGAYAGVKADRKRVAGKDRLKGAKPVPFTSFLKDASAADSGELEPLPDMPVSEETVRLLLDDVHTTGEQLKERPFPEQIRRYKTAVRNFLHYVVENGYTVEERVSGANLLKRKKFTLIQVVDKKLEQLAAGILAGQSSQLDILARVDEISGILVNLLR